MDRWVYDLVNIRVHNARMLSPERYFLPFALLILCVCEDTLL